MILTTWLAVVFSLSSLLREPLTHLALWTSSSKVELFRYSLDSDLSISSDFRFGLELGSGVLPASIAFNCQVITTPSGLVSGDAAFSTSSRLLGSTTGEEGVVVSDIGGKQDDNSLATVVEDDKKQIYHRLTKGKKETNVPGRVVRDFHC